MGIQVELVVDDKNTLGEGPIWKRDSGEVGWVDIVGRKVHFLELASGKRRSYDVGEQVGAAVLTADGQLLCAMENGFYRFDPETGERTALADPESELPGNRFNDGKCDSAGRFWAGTMPKDGSDPTGSLYTLEVDGTVRKKLTGIRCSNGLGWSPDDKTLHYIDTHTMVVQSFDFDAATGEIANGRSSVTIGPDMGWPDGMCVDAEGFLWIAHWGGYRVTRWNPETGEQVGQIDLPVSQVTSCCFAGENLDELYITSARVGLSEEQLSREPLAGGLFKCKPGVAGMEVHPYRG